MSDIVEITDTRTFWRRWCHYLFKCPTFWQWKRAFTCPDCGAKYRCYWDGNDAGGEIDLCNKCVGKYK